MTSHVQIEPWSEAIGLRPSMSAADAQANIDELFGDSDAGAQRRKAVLEGVDLMNYEKPIRATSCIFLYAPAESLAIAGVSGHIR